MIYYTYSYFYIFLLIILFFFLILIFLYPNYDKRTLVPPLNDDNYNLNLSGPVGIPRATNLETITFRDAYIEEDTGIEIDPSEPTDGQSAIVFVPEFSKSNKYISGYFLLYVTKSSVGSSYDLVFRAYDAATSQHSRLSAYNKGWAPLHIPITTGPTIPIFKVLVPFKFNARARGISHKINLQIGAIGSGGTIPATDLKLNSAYVYYN